MAADNRWFAEVKTGSRTEALPGTDGIYSGKFTLPESVLFYHEPDRSTYRPAEKDIFTRYLSLDLCIEADADCAVQVLPVKLFVKDKDGIFFQSVETFRLRSGEWQTLTVDMTGPARAWEGVGHEWIWGDLAVSRIFNVGFKIFSDESFKGSVRWKNHRFHTARELPELKVLDWNMPSEVKQNNQLTGTFTLSREYFNNFDPAEVAVDIEVKSAQSTGAGRIFPAFYNLKYRRHIDYTREYFLPYGRTFWEFRYFAGGPGKYSIRLRVKDKNDSIVTQWRNFEVLSSDDPGVVGISPVNPDYLGFADGRPFWSVGLNIHTNIDLRGELAFNLGHRPDRGVADYEDYFHAAAEHSINSIEIWMANWSFAIEGDVSLSGMYGVGSYNLERAAKLDLLLDLARKNNIYIHLVLDNHGKISKHVDPEWDVNPMNSKNAAAKANGGFIDTAGKFWTDAAARQVYDSRNRYLAARYGADPAIWGIEFWSECNLTDDFGARYKDGKMIKWHEESAKKWQAMDSAGHLLTTHMSGSYEVTKNYIKLYKIDNIGYIAGDAYRNRNSRVDDFLLAGHRVLKKSCSGKPYIITEYGGDPSGSSPQNMLSDIHAGLWVSFFAGYAGSPLLWWHDFVHVNNYYVHHRGLAGFIADINRDDPLLEAHANVNVNNTAVRAMCLTAPKELYAWIYDAAAMLTYPEKPEKVIWPQGQIQLHIKDLKVLEKGIYKAVYYNTVTNEEIAVQQVEYNGGDLILNMPEFVVDCALKMRYLQAIPEKGQKQ